MWEGRLVSFGRRERRRKRRLEPGDGHPLKPFRFWNALTRTRFYAPLYRETNNRLVYAVEVDYFDGEMKADLYLNGRHHARATMPALFPVKGGDIEVALSSYGLKRMHYVPHSGGEHVLTPDGRSAEGLRARLARRTPRLSRAIGATAIVVLLCLLPLGLLQAADFISHTDIATQYIDPFTSPISLPGWANTATILLTIIAGIERALTLRNHWLIDMETGWFSG